jgi:hypothetical protein
MESASYKGKLAPHRVNNPEHLYASYNLVNHSKINFIRHAKSLYPGYEFYSWLDFGMCRNVDDCPFNVCTAVIPKDKITYLALNYPGPYRMDPVDMLRSDKIYLTGSLFIAHTNKVDEFEQAFDAKIREYHGMSLSDDDQSLVTQMYWDNPDLFHLVFDTEWFCLFRKHYNKVNI